MKTIRAMVVVLLCGLLAGSAWAGGFKSFSVALSGASTNFDYRSMQGELAAVAVTVPAGATGTVSLANADGLYFTNADMTASGLFVIRAPVVSISNTTFNYTGATNGVVDVIPIMGLTTAKVYQTSATTNTWTIKAMYR